MLILAEVEEPIHARDPFMPPCALKFIYPKFKLPVHGGQKWVSDRNRLPDFNFYLFSPQNNKMEILMKYDKKYNFFVMYMTKRQIVLL